MLTLKGVRKFCKFSDDKYPFRVLTARNRITEQDLSVMLGFCSNTISTRRAKGIWFSQGEYDEVKKILKASDE